MTYGLQRGAEGREIRKTGTRVWIPGEGRVKKENSSAHETRASRVFKRPPPRLTGRMEWGEWRETKKGT